MSRFIIFRIRTRRGGQDSFFQEIEKPSPEQLIEAAVKEKPFYLNWRIGNIRSDGDFLSFFFGKKSKASIKVSDFDDEKKDFSDEDAPQAPHTRVMIDLKYQLCAIATKSSLASIETLHNSLEKTLNNSSTARVYDTIFDIKSIYRLEKFFSMLESAQEIIQFEMNFSPPNPWDTEDFEEVAQNLLGETHAESGKFILKGKNLLVEKIIELARVVNKAGNKLKAKVIMKKGEKPKLVSSDNNIPLEVDSENENENIDPLRVRDAYESTERQNLD